MPRSERRHIDPDCDQFTEQECSAFIAWWMGIGQALTTEEIARRLHMRPNSAYKLLRRLQRRVLVDVDYVDGSWRRIKA